MLSEFTHHEIPATYNCFAFGMDLDVVGSVTLPNGPPSNRAIRRVPLQNAKELALGHSARLIVWRRFHPLSRLGGVRLRGFLRRPRATGFRASFASNSHEFWIMRCSPMLG